MFILFFLLFFCPMLFSALPCPEAFTPVTTSKKKAKQLRNKGASFPTSSKKRPSQGINAKAFPTSRGDKKQKVPNKTGIVKGQNNLSPLQVAQKQWTPAQKATFLAYTKALQAKTKSFLHIAPFLEGNNVIMAYTLVEHLIHTTRKTKAHIQGQKMAIVTVNQAQQIEPLAHVIREVVLKYAEIMDIDVISWNKKEKALDLALSPFSGSVLVMTHRMLQSLLRNPDSENYDLLSSYLSMVVLHLNPSLLADLSQSILDLQKNSQAFVYTMSTTPLHQSTGFEGVFQKTHWSYLNTKANLFEDHIMPNPKVGVLKQLSAGVRQGELTYWSGPHFISLPKEELDKPVLVSENDIATVNPVYYPVLAKQLQPVLQSHHKGVLITGTHGSAKRLAVFLNNTFPEMNFANYSYSQPLEARQDILRDSQLENHHYIVSARSVAEIESLSYLSAYIDLNINTSVVDRLSLASPILGLYKGKNKAQIVLLDHTYKKTEEVSEYSPPTSLEHLLHYVEVALDSNAKALDSSSTEKGEVVVPSQHRRSVKPHKPKRLSHLGNKPTAGVKKQNRKTRMLPWEEALKKVREANLPNMRAYFEWQKDHPDMPYKPYKHYAKHWSDWTYFLGKQVLKKLSWEEALKKVREANIFSRRAYEEWQKDHPDMPRRPDRFYADWQGWSHFFEKHVLKKLSWEKNLKKVRRANLSSGEAYREWQKDHPDMPRRPDAYYADYWQGWPHFLGKKVLKMLSWEKTLKKVREANLSDRKAYRKWQKNHPDIPSNPDTYYAKHWQSWAHFFDKIFLPWEEALKKVREANLSGKEAYEKWKKDHPDMPYKPSKYYAENWQSWTYFLGNEKLPWKEALKKVRKAGVKTIAAYKEWKKDHPDMPAHPDRYYAEHWQGWPYFIGDKRLSWEEALKKVRKANLPNMRAYQAWQKDHPDMPSNPDRYYAEHWQNGYHFLGNEKLPWEGALKKVREAGIKTVRAYREWQKDHPNMPYNPLRHYADHWQGWDHFFDKAFLPWEGALKKVRKAKLNSIIEYSRWLQQNNIKDMPTRPDHYLPYKQYWQSWPHFLGKNPGSLKT